jgi:flagellar protein FlaG
MDVNSFNRIAQGAAATATPIPPENASQNRQVVQAVKALNRSEMFGEQNNLEFRRDPDTRRMVVKVVNRNTGEVVSQIPPEYVLRLSESLKQNR